MKESKVAAKIFEKQHQKYHKTCILHIVFFNVFVIIIIIIVSVNIFTDCLISVPYVKSIQAGTTTTTGTKHSARKLMPHATTVGPFTRSLWNTTTFNQLQDLFRSIGYSFCHISWDEALVCFICFPFIIHGIERRWISTQGTVPLGNLKVFSVNILLKCFSCWWQTT